MSGKARQTKQKKQRFLLIQKSRNFGRALKEIRGTCRLCSM
ncbi:hypothetical protein CGRA01v4_04290 [Colletotrichum graminicola]|nr:hypothetical protein CGRA01v4_04290 [Colletotrichum graminicola]